MKDFSLNQMQFELGYNCRLWFAAQFPGSRFFFFLIYISLIERFVHETNEIWISIKSSLFNADGD
jgi:hypothetical protein